MLKPARSFMRFWKKSPSMNRIRISFIFLCVCACFQSCIYECDVVSKVDVVQPDPWHQMDITLSVDKDSIILFGPTDFSYNVETFGLKFNATIVKFLGHENNYYTSNQSFTLDPGSSNAGEWLDLTIECYLSTGSGSIADRLMAENYIGQKTWKVKYIDLQNFDYKFSNHVNADGLVELYYIKPPFTDLTNGHVSFSGNAVPCSKVHGDTVFFADSLYYGGSRTYYFSLQINENDYIGGNTSVDYPFPTLSFTNISLDSCLVSWTPCPVKLTYNLTCGGVQRYLGTGFSYMDIQPRPGQRFFYQLTSYSAKTVNPFAWSNSTSTYHVLGTTTAYKICYSKSSGMFFVSRKRSYPAIEKFQTLPEDDSNGYYGSNYDLYSNSAGTVIIGKSWGTLSVFDENLSLKKTLTIPKDAEQIQVSNNNSVGYYYNKQYTILNVGSDASWSSFSFHPHYDDSVFTYTRIYIGAINLTSDGNYVCCRAAYDFYLYDVSDHKNAKLVLTASRDSVSRVMGNPLNNNELIVQGMGKYEIRSCPDFKFIRVFDANYLNGCVFCNVDPASNLMLCSTSTHYVIIDLATMKEVFRLKSPGAYEYNARLFNKHLIVGLSSVDLSPYLN